VQIQSSLPGGASALRKADEDGDGTIPANGAPGPKGWLRGIANLDEITDQLHEDARAVRDVAPPVFVVAVLAMFIPITVIMREVFAQALLYYEGGVSLVASKGHGEEGGGYDEVCDSKEDAWILVGNERDHSR